MASRSCTTAVAGAFFLLVLDPVRASPQVVGDEACALHAVDIAAFATCEDGKVVRPVADDPVPAPPALPALAWRADAAADAHALARRLLAALTADAAPPERGCAGADVQPR